MYDYLDVYNKYKELVDRIHQANEFWTNSFYSCFKEFLKV